MNALVDQLNGDDFATIFQRPRRFMYLDPRNKMVAKKYPILLDFVDPAYTDDNGDIIKEKKRACIWGWGSRRE